MKNKTPFPVISEGPDQSIVFHHSDLDGFNGGQICQKWLEEQFGDNHQVKLVKVGYEQVNPLAEDTFKDSGDWRYIMFVDISINEELATSAPENTFIFDHHDTSNYLLDMNSRYYWNEKYCGAVVAWQALFGGRKDKKFMKLMKICNDYDMWQGDDGQPPKLSFDMNALFWKDPEKWFLDFYDGFEGFSDEQQQILDDHWKMQDDIWEKMFKHVYDGEDPQVLFLEGNDARFDCNWWYNKLLREDGIKIVFHLRAERDRVSVRTSRDMDWFHIGEWLKDNIHNIHNSKGGHRHAGGCSTEGMEVDEIIEVGQKLEDICKAHFNKQAAANG